MTGHPVRSDSVSSGPPPTAAPLAAHLHATVLPQVHILAHSMGARVLAGAADTIADAFAPPAAAAAATNGLAGSRSFHLGSVILLSPDMELGEFAGHTGPLLRSLCDNVVIYGDEADSALNIASISAGLLFKVWPGLAMPGLAEHW